jgi:TolA-binding protein
MSARVVEPASHPTGTAPAANPPAVLPSVTAADLFAQANEARRRSDVDVAVKKYRELQHRFPGSGEASMSRVMLGRLYLDRVGDAASALAQFDGYARGGDGSLREEALVGRALALQRLGRGAEEKKAWQALLAAYPQSLSADRAHARLAEPP